ncbi:hypothetical protein LINPERHAP1_LOCUS7364 [Linum perenne]
MIASLLGTPVQTDMHSIAVDGLGHAKACVLMSKGAERPLVLNVVPDGFDPITIDLEYLPPRDYSRKTSAVASKSKWKQKGVIGSSVDPPRTVELIQVPASKEQPSSSAVVSEESLQLPVVISEEPAANKVIPESPTKQSSAGSSPNKGTTSVASDLRSSQVGGIALTGSQFGALALDDPKFPALHSSLPPVASKRKLTIFMTEFSVYEYGADNEDGTIGDKEDDPVGDPFEAHTPPENSVGLEFTHLLDDDLRTTDDEFEDALFTIGVRMTKRRVAYMTYSSGEEVEQFVLGKKFRSPALFKHAVVNHAIHVGANLIWLRRVASSRREPYEAATASTSSSSIHRDIVGLKLYAVRSQSPTTGVSVNSLSRFSLKDLCLDEPRLDICD